MTSVGETAYPTREFAFTPDFSEVSVARSLVLCVVFCRSLFVLFLLLTVLSVLLQLTASGYPFGIFKLCSTFVIYFHWRNRLQFSYPNFVHPSIIYSSGNVVVKNIALLLFDRCPVSILKPKVYVAIYMMCTICNAPHYTYNTS